jgi:hypothetical protein
MKRGLDPETADELCDAACKAMDDRGNSRTTQDAMAKQFAEKKPPFYRPTNPNCLPEVSQVIPATKGGGMTTLMSSTGAPVGAGGPLAPMSMMHAMRKCAPGTMTRWDFIIPENAAAPVTNANIKNYVEVKFPNDQLTDNQKLARSRMTPAEKAKIIEMKPDEDCICTKKGGKVKGKARQRAPRK